MDNRDFWSMDLSSMEPTSKSKRPKKDHKCPHEPRRGYMPTGMEVCRACGDFGICRECGVEYIRRDMYGGPVCYPCARIVALRFALHRALAEQAERKAENTPAPAESEAK